ncbi:putative ribonuclease H-like domain-containing protein [Tanacetum coccineum]
MYSFDMKSIVSKESLTCLIAKATSDESMLWHRRLGHINFKNINKLVKDNLVRGLPTKHLEIDQTCVACLKGKQHKASYKSKVLNPIAKPLFMLHIDLFGPTFVTSEEISQIALLMPIWDKIFILCFTYKDVIEQQALFKLYLIHPGWMQCRKNFCIQTSTVLDAMWIFTSGKKPLETIWVLILKKYLLSVQEIEAIKMFLAYGFFLWCVSGFKDPDHLDKVYKVVKALYGLHQAPRAWYETLANYLLSNGFKRGKIDQTLFIKKQKGDIYWYRSLERTFIFGSTNKELCTGFEKLMSQDKYVAEILKKFNYSDVKSASTPVDLEKPLVKDGDADDVDVHLYRSMIGSLMYLTASRPDIMFAVCACARFQVTPKTSHLLAVKRIFRYLKGKPTLGLWYSRDSPFELVAYTDSDYAGATQDRKSTTGGCQFLGNRLISWQCKKQTVVATSTTEAEYVAAASCCGQVLYLLTKGLEFVQEDFSTLVSSFGYA